MDNEEMLNPEEQDDIIELVDEEGQSVFFERLASFRFNETDYLALLPTEEDEDEDEEEAESLNVIIMKIELDEDGNDIIVVPEEEEADAAFEYFVNLVDEREDEE